MDFGTLINVAQKNETKKQTVPCYQTKFTPPKKQTKQSKTLSDNIKKFLARKEEEEKQKALEEKRKRENLLALRDSKAQSRISKHLKVCKAANKSVIADAIDSENTAITIAGPSQPDEDDYGYVSQEASTFYNQLMSKYNSLPPEKPIFNNNEKRTIKDITSTKDRVKQALKQQELEENSGHRRKRKSASSIKEAEIDEKIEKNIADKNKEENKDEKPKPKRKSLPSPMGFAELLKLAEKKQHEPVMIEVKPKVDEERPMTKRQKMEYIHERERKEQRGKKDLETDKKISTTSTLNKSNKTQLNKIPKTSEKSPILNSILNKNSSKTATTISKKIIDKSNEKQNTEKYNSSKISSKNELLEERKKLEAEKRQLEEMRRAIEEEKRKLEQSKNKQEDIKSHSSSKEMIKSKGSSIDKQIPKDIKSRQFPPLDLKSSLTNNKLKQTRPLNIKSTKSKEIVKKPPNKRRIYDEDEDLDASDLDDFIDDGSDDNEEDYSKHISEIFGYDKNKYKHLDNEDDTAMESNFAQQLKEEYISTKIGIMEDLEDMRKEALEKKKKDLLKKKLRK
ncbi:Protein SPT2-like protein [Camponotus floridanus]|uniref:Protein SPT2 homolog n=1 Tax=Camponotus floridanus TaxID=104421 RepID=E2A8Q3_CAMFO|nr:protein SPT2 homolog [Camponotus floridanus]EFN70132.1 Protein SPT2-like protein [Camponotus floridanus]